MLWEKKFNDIWVLYTGWGVPVDVTGPVTETGLGSPDSTAVASSRCDPEIQYLVLILLLYHVLIYRWQFEWGFIHAKFCALQAHVKLSFFRNTFKRYLCLKT